MGDLPDPSHFSTYGRIGLCLQVVWFVNSLYDVTPVTADDGGVEVAVVFHCAFRGLAT
jgi:hypothetical protein